MNKTFNPKVSIIIPVYNGSKYLNEAIDSALSQTYKNIEVIVVNDGSNDEGKTDEICKSYGKKIRYFIKKNGGVATALNLGIKKMKGDYFSWLSHDDVYYPEKVESQVSILQKLDDKRTLIFSGYEIIDVEGNLLGTMDFSKKHTKKNLEKPLYAFFHMCLNGCTMLIHKSYFERFGVFNPELPTTQDYDLWFRFYRSSRIFYDPNIFFKSRSHGEQDSRNYIDTHVGECNTFWLRILNEITAKEIKSMADSKFDYYFDLYLSFKELTLYDQLIEYLFVKSFNSLIELYNEKTTKIEKEKILTKFVSLVGKEKPLTENAIKRFLEFEPKKSKKRIMFFTGAWFDRGGLNRMITSVSTVLSSDYDVIVCSMREIGNEDGYELGKKVRYLELEPNEFVHIPKILKLLDVDVFVGSNNCFLPFLKLYKQIKLFEIKTIMWNHEHYFLPYYKEELREASIFRKQIFQEVDVVLWLTWTSAFLCKQFVDNVAIIGNSITSQKLNKVKVNQESLNIISVGRFDSYQKRIDRLMKVYSEVLKKREDIKLLLVGPYDLDLIVDESLGVTLKKLIHKLKIPMSSIIFTGQVKDPSEYYSRAKVNIMTSEKEGFGLTILEAAQVGIPSIVFGGGGSSDIIKNNINGFVIKENDYSGMAERIINMFDDEKLYQRISAESTNLAKEYSLENMASKWKNLIESVMKYNKKELKKILDQEYFIKSTVSEEKLYEITSGYENALESQISKNILDKELLEELDIHRNIVYGMENSKSWKITKPFRILTKGIALIRKQGLIPTFKKFLLKIKYKKI